MLISSKSVMRVTENHMSQNVVLEKASIHAMTGHQGYIDETDAADIDPYDGNGSAERANSPNERQFVVGRGLAACGGLCFLLLAGAVSYFLVYSVEVSRLGWGSLVDVLVALFFGLWGLDLLLSRDWQSPSRVLQGRMGLARAVLIFAFACGVTALAPFARTKPLTLTSFGISILIPSALVLYRRLRHR